MHAIELVSHDLCPFVQRAVIALAEKGVPFKRTDIDLDDRPQWFKDISPLGKVPLLRVQGEVIFESAVILEYLDETQAPALHPSSPLARARHRAWIEYASSLLMDNYGLILASDAAALMAKRDVIREKILRLDKALGQGPYFDGTTFCLVDVAFAPFFRYWEAFERIEDFGVFEGAARTQRWRRALAARPSVRGSFTSDYDARLLQALGRRSSQLARLARRAPVSEERRA